jgi:hypothetical protein
MIVSVLAKGVTFLCTEFSTCQGNVGFFLS